MPSACNNVLCFQQISKKELEFTSEVWVISHSVSCNTLLRTSWLPILVSTKSSQTILLIDRFEPRCKSHTGGKIRTTKKNQKI